jgi:peptidoglycan-N-acetylglucosamine deacetylase
MLSSAKSSGSTRIRSPAKRRVVMPSHAVEGQRNVWLTFDDGPHPTRTDQVLTVLAKYNIKATFFLIGRNARSFEAVVRRAFESGHRIGNHSYTHPLLTKLSEAQVRAELKRTEEAIAKYAPDEKIFRPPYGAHNATVDRVVSQLGYRLILWNVDTVDWNAKYQPTKWVQHGLDQIRSRKDSKVLNHDIHKSTADHLETFIKRIKRLGKVNFQPPSTL